MTSPKKFRKKPVIVEAMQFDGTASGQAAIVTWSEGKVSGWFDSAYHLLVQTLEGDMRADVGDWIVRGTQGEFYPVKPASFAGTFEEVEIGGLDKDCCTDESLSCDNELCYRAIRDYGDPEVGT